jgi:hypothetical protein
MSTTAMATLKEVKYYEKDSKEWVVTTETEKETLELFALKDVKNFKLGEMECVAHKETNSIKKKLIGIISLRVKRVTCHKGKKYIELSSVCYPVGDHNLSEALKEYKNGKITSYIGCI